MRRLDDEEMELISGGLIRTSAMPNPMVLKPPTGGGGGAPATWTTTPVYNGLGQDIGENVNMGDGLDLITTSQSDVFNESFGNVDVQLAHELGTSDNSIQATQDIDGTSVAITTGYDTDNGLYVSGKVSFGDATVALGTNSSGDLLTGGSFDADGFTGSYSINLSTGTLDLSGSQIDIGPVQCNFDIFGLGGNDEGAGVVCWDSQAHGDEQVVGSPGTATEASYGQGGSYNAVTEAA